MVLKMIQQGLIGLIAVGSGVVNDATAQERHGSQEAIEEVVVTATRRSESLQDVSGSLSALTTEDILDLGLDNLQGFARLVPGTQLHQPLKNRSVFTIRGINTDIGDTQLTQEPVALYINDMPATNPYAELVQPDLALYDIERIEVLRGPQGTLFGSGSLGGAVRIITRQPVMNETEASFRVDFADVSEAGLRQRYDGMVNVPLVEDKLALRAVAYVRDAEGWVENTNLGLENGTEDWGARLALQWYPSEKLSARFEVLYEDSDPGDADSWNPEFGEFKRFSLIDESRPYELLMTNATLEYDFGFASLLSSTNFKSVDTSWRTEFGEIPGIGAIVNQSPFFNYDSAVQEFRLVSNSDGPIDWVAGLYYFDNEVDSLLDVEIRGLQEFLQAILGPGAMTAGKLIAAGAVQESEELAAYGDLTWQFSSDWSVSAGLRVFETETVFDQGPSLVFDFATLQDLMVPGFVNVADDNDFTWRTALSYTPNDDRHFYATISKGFRVGQVNPNNGPSFV
ncbi:MAG: TonB-dependent receptor, partial [Xanthomonadales bacterium]|nr:TonB-dependent receptor [Xanthomonadales bacterium]